MNKILNKLRRSRSYYISYSVKIDHQLIYGSGTFDCKGRPDLEMWLSEIRRHNKHDNAVILSCVECRNNFL